MAYTPIQPLPITENPLLKIASEGLSYIRQVNEIKRQENQKRQEEIIKLLRDVDFPTAMEMVNKKKQMEIFKAGENALMSTLAKSAKNNGMISMQDRLEQERIVRTLEQELTSIKQGEDKFKKKMEEIAKSPGQYTLESMNKFNDLYLKEGEYREDILQYTPVPFSVVENGFYTMFKDGVKDVQTVENGKEVTRQIIDMPDSEKQANYEAIRNKMPGVAEYEIQTFRALKENDPAMYNKYKQEGIDEKTAANMWAMDEVATKLGTGRVTDIRPYEPKKTNDENDRPLLKMTEREDGFKVWHGGTQAKPFNGTITTIDGKKEIVSNGRLTEVYQGSDGKSYAVIINNKKGVAEPKLTGDPDTDKTIRALTAAFGGKETTITEEIIIPYEGNQELIKGAYNLENAYLLDKQTSSSTKFKGVPKGGF